MDSHADSPAEQPPQRAAAPRISVIVPVRNDPAHLKLCLHAIRQSIFTGYEVIVADDASTDNTVAIAEAEGAQIVRLPKRSGPAAARNAAAEVARGEILLFVDADVCLHPDSLVAVDGALNNPEIDAVFGSYDLHPAEPNLLSQFKNLSHRYYHQTAGDRATTFWTGCGAIRRDVFLQFKFDPQRFPRPSIEDIDLGSRLTRAGKKIAIDKSLQATHLKRWTLFGIFKSDLFDRAIPWTLLILRQGQIPGELNLSLSQRMASLLTLLSAAILLVSCWFKPWLMLLPFAVYGAILFTDIWTTRRPVSTRARWISAVAIMLAIVVAILYARWSMLAIAFPLLIVLLLNGRYYLFFLHHRGPLFALSVFPMQVGYYLYGLGGFGTGHAIHYVQTIERLDRFSERLRLYAAVTAVLYVLAWMLVLVRAHVKQTTVDFAVSDAIGYYVYLPSLVIDHDLKFENQLSIQFPVKDEEYSQALQHNRWPTGIALSIAPAFLVAHGTAILVHYWTGWSLFAPTGYSPVYFVFCVGWAMLIGLAGIILLDRLLIQRFLLRGRLVAGAILLTWLATHYVWYFVREPLMAHMIGASWVIFAIYLVHRIEQFLIDEPLPWWPLPLLALVMSMALICRMTNAFLLPMFIYLAVLLHRRGQMMRALQMLPLILLAMWPLALQLYIWKIVLAGLTSQGVQGMGYGENERFVWTQPALLRSLFSSRHGLFFTTPILLFSLWGWIWHLLRRGGWRDLLLSSLAASALLLWYINSAWYAWWFGPSVGNRGYVELAALFAIGFAFGIVWLNQKNFVARRIIMGLMVLATLFSFSLIGLKLLGKIGDNQLLIPWEEQVLTGRWKRI